MRTMVILGVMIAWTAAAMSPPPAAETTGGNIIHRPSPTFAQRCAPWDEAASRVVSERAQASDLNVRLVSESIAGMRRARRLCALGSLTDACIEYDAIIRGVERRLQGGVMPAMCRAVASDVPAS